MIDNELTAQMLSDIRDELREMNTSDAKAPRAWESTLPIPAVLMIVGMMAICIICLGLVALNDGQNTTDDGIIMSETTVEEVISQGGPKASATTVGEWDRFDYDGQKEFGK